MPRDNFNFYQKTKALDVSRLKGFADDIISFIDCAVFNPLPDDKILDWFKLKQIADDILKCT